MEHAGMESCGEAAESPVAQDAFHTPHGDASTHRHMPVGRSVTARLRAPLPTFGRAPLPCLHATKREKMEMRGSPPPVQGSYVSLRGASAFTGQYPWTHA